MGFLRRIITLSSAVAFLSLNAFAELPDQGNLVLSKESDSEQKVVNKSFPLDRDIYRYRDPTRFPTREDFPNSESDSAIEGERPQFTGLHLLPDEVYWTELQNGQCPSFDWTFTLKEKMRSGTISRIRRRFRVELVFERIYDRCYITSYQVNLQKIKYFHRDPIWIQMQTLLLDWPFLVLPFVYEDSAEYNYQISKSWGYTYQTTGPKRRYFGDFKSVSYHDYRPLKAAVQLRLGAPIISLWPDQYGFYHSMKERFWNYCSSPDDTFKTYHASRSSYHLYERRTRADGFYVELGPTLEFTPANWPEVEEHYSMPIEEQERFCTWGM